MRARIHMLGESLAEWRHPDASAVQVDGKSHRPRIAYPAVVVGDDESARVPGRV